MKNVMKNVVIIFIISLMMFLIMKDIQMLSKQNIQKITYYELQEKIEKTKNKVIIFEKENGELITEVDNNIYSTNIKPNSDILSELLKEKNIEYGYKKEVSLFSIIFQYGIPLLIVVFILMMLFGKGRGSRETAQQKEKIIQLMEIPKTELSEVGGLNEEAKREIQQIIEIFKNKEEAIEMGIKPAKGVILHGPPGTGKTLLAKAIANGLQANFYSTSGSAFSEMFVGVGASRVRELFDNARKNAPSLIFIDEIDSVAKKRGTMNSHEERENTLNELLRQMDGVEVNNDVFVVAATNRLDILDEAILRPGRFDHKILIGYPDLEGRKEIIAIHSQNKKLSEELKDNLEKLAEDTIGYTGAEIENLFNLAAKKAMLKKKKEIEMEEINESIDSAILGNKNKPIKDENTRKRVAYHEAGHALVQVLLVPKEIRKATIIPRGGALGYVATTPKELELLTKKEMINEIAMILAGGIAEISEYGEHSIGVSGDVKQAKNIINKMVEVGMANETFELVFEEKEQNKVKEELFKEAKTLAEKTIKENKEKLKRIAELLLEKETVEGKEIEKIVK